MRKKIKVFLTVSSFVIIVIVPTIALAEIYYINGACTNNGDGSARTCASSPGGTGAHNSTDDVTWTSLSAGDIVYICGANDQTGANGTDFNGEYLINDRSEQINFSSGGGSEGNPVIVAEDSTYPDPWLTGSSKEMGWSAYSGNVYRKNVGSRTWYKGVFWDGILMKSEPTTSAVNAPGDYHYDGSQYLYVYGYGDAFNNGNGVPGYSNTDYDPDNHDVRHGYYNDYIKIYVSDVTIDGINMMIAAGGHFMIVQGSSGNDLQRVHIRNSEMYGTGPGCYGIWYEFASNGEITGNAIYYLGGWTYMHSSADGIYIHYGDNNLIENNYVHYAEHALIAVRGKYGSSDYTLGNIVRGNHLSYGESGMITVLNGAQDTIVEYNYFYYAMPTATQGNATVPAIEIGHYSDSGEGPTKNVTIRYNIIDTSLQGISIGFGGQGLPNYMEGIYIYNNLFYHVGRTNDDWDGEWWGQGYLNFSNIAAIHWEEGDDVIGPSTYIYGNIFYDCGDDSRVIVVAKPNSGDFSGLDYNVYYSPHGTDNYWFYKGANLSWSIMKNSYNLSENALVDHNTSFRDAVNNDFRLEPGDNAIHSMSTHPISSWDSNPGSYPSDLIWENVNSGYSELKGKSTKQGSGFDAGACEFVLAGDGEPPARPTGLRIQ